MGMIGDRWRTKKGAILCLVPGGVTIVEKKENR